MPIGLLGARTIASAAAGADCGGAGLKKIPSGLRRPAPPKHQQLYFRGRKLSGRPAVS